MPQSWSMHAVRHKTSPLSRWRKFSQKYFQLRPGAAFLVSQIRNGMSYVRVLNRRWSPPHSASYHHPYTNYYGLYTAPFWISDGVMNFSPAIPERVSTFGEGEIYLLPWVVASLNYDSCVLLLSLILARFLRVMTAHAVTTLPSMFGPCRPLHSACNDS